MELCLVQPICPGAGGWSQCAAQNYPAGLTTLWGGLIENNWGRQLEQKGLWSTLGLGRCLFCGFILLKWKCADSYKVKQFLGNFRSHWWLFQVHDSLQLFIILTVYKRKTHSQQKRSNLTKEKIIGRVHSDLYYKEIIFQWWGILGVLNG